MSKYFVWINGLSGPEPQKWGEEQYVNQKPVPTLAKHELTPLENNLPISELVNRYPYEAKS